jgi:DNA polymerase-3 subunit delta
MPLHILYGYEALTRGEALAELKASLDTDGALATNLASFSAHDTTPQEVVAACDTVPFLGEHRLVVLEGAMKATAARAKRGRKAAEAVPEDLGPWAALTDYADRMPATTTLVLVDGDVPASNALLAELKPKAATCRSFAPPREKELPGWIAARAREIDLKLDGPATRLMAELIGPASEDFDRKSSNLPLIASELEKLKAYANGDVVREADVRDLVSRAKEHKGWDLSDAVADRQPVKATRVLAEMLEDGDHEGPLLATIATKFRRIAVARELLDKGASRAEIGRRLKMQDNFGLTRLIEQAETMDMAAIRQSYEALVQADLVPKSGRMDGKDGGKLALELAVAELSMPVRRGRP